MATSFVIQSGYIGIGVNKIQGYLNIFQSRGLIQTRNLQDGVFGTNTKNAVMQFQQYASLPVNGIVDETTFDAMIHTLKDLNVYPFIPVASNSFYLSINQQGLAVYMMQKYLNAIADTTPCLRAIVLDGYYGQETREMVSQYQYLKNLKIDGIIGSRTWDEIVNDYLRTL